MERREVEVDTATKNRIGAKKVRRISARIQLEGKQKQSRIKHRAVQPGESVSDTSERFRTGALLILVAMIDTVSEWHLWTRAGGVMMGILVLSRLALFAYGAQKLRHYW
jgi:hypothetical protein